MAFPGDAEWQLGCKGSLRGARGMMLLFRQLHSLIAHGAWAGNPELAGGAGRVQGRVSTDPARQLGATAERSPVTNAN